MSFWKNPVFTSWALRLFIRIEEKKLIALVLVKFFLLHGLKIMVNELVRGLLFLPVFNVCGKVKCLWAACATGYNQ